jgi:hypothetical protein
MLQQCLSANNLPVVSPSLCANSYVSADLCGPRDCVAIVVVAPASSPTVDVPHVCKPNVPIGWDTFMDVLHVVFLTFSQDSALLLANSFGLCSLASYVLLPLDGVVHFNVEQRDRCERAEMLPQLCHMTYDCLCEALADGHFVWSTVTSHLPIFG